MNVTTVLSFIADQIDGALHEYDDGYVIECHNGTPYPVLFTYSTDGELENTKLKGYKSPKEVDKLQEAYKDALSEIDHLNERLDAWED